MDRGYINIAIIKYWGKKEFNPYLIPMQSSISIRSSRAYTETEIFSSKEDEFYLNGDKQSEEETKKVFSFIDKIINRKEKIRIVSYNFVPTAAGLASSSSGYCALTKAINRYFNLNLSKEKLSKISTIGSGSAGRSFYKLAAFDNKGEIYEINTDLNLSMLAIIVSTNKKSISSREAMENAKKSSIYSKWVERANKDFEKMKIALNNNDFNSIGRLMENNTIFMHNTTIRSNPSFSFLTKESYGIIKKIRRLRYKGLNIYFTADAGPNIKVIYLKEEENKIIKILTKEFKDKIYLC